MPDFGTRLHMDDYNDILPRGYKMSVDMSQSGDTTSYQLWISNGKDQTILFTGTAGTPHGDFLKKLGEDLVETLVIADYEEVLESKQKLVGELDEIINGKEGRASRPSLCDIIGQIKHAGLFVRPRADIRDRIELADFIKSRKTYYPEKLAEDILNSRFCGR